MIHVAHLLRKIRYLCFCLVCAMPFPAAAAETIFTVQPILEHSTMLKLYTPLASFLAKASQKPVELRLVFDFPEYWFRLKGGKEFDIVFDGPFYTDYLIQAHGYIPLVKLPGTVSFSLIARSSDGFLSVFVIRDDMTGPLHPILVGATDGFKDHRLDDLNTIESAAQWFERGSQFPAKD